MYLYNYFKKENTLDLLQYKFRNVQFINVIENHFKYYVKLIF